MLGLDGIHAGRRPCGYVIHSLVVKCQTAISVVNNRLHMFTRSPQVYCATSVRRLPPEGEVDQSVQQREQRRSSANIHVVCPTCAQ